jgi:3-hydroxybutyryl-CoA dehydratase
MLGPTFEQVSVGDVFSGSMTVTETHVVIAAGLFGDFAPLHVDEEYARGTAFGTRIAHGTLTTGIMAGVLSGYFHGTAIGYLEQDVRFRNPLLPGDTVTSEWEVLEKVEKRKLGGGIVALRITCRKQDGRTILEGTAKAIIRGQAASLDAAVEEG